jgi:hypothetical protein
MPRARDKSTCQLAGSGAPFASAVSEANKVINKLATIDFSLNDSNSDALGDAYGYLIGRAQYRAPLYMSVIGTSLA